MAELKRCALCRQPGTKDNPVNRHHIKGKNYPDIMPTHSRTCHLFAQYVTNLYLLRGMEDELDDRRIIYLFNRLVTLRHGDNFVLPVFRASQ